MNSRYLKTIAFYLPQFHPIPENDKWWGKGFTEWTNVKKAKPLFEGHQQPVEPGELGYYDLRDPEVRLKQAELAKQYGITGFCYWHYWFGNGKTLLDLPFNEVLKNREPDFPFCLGWANESWTGIWHGAPEKVLMEQKYPGEEDIRKHFEHLLPAFEDDRYIKINNKPFFLLYKPLSHHHLKRFTGLFNELAMKEGFGGIHFIATNVPEKWNMEEFNFQAIVPPNHNKIVWANKNKLINKVKKYVSGYSVNHKPKHIYQYQKAMKYFLPDTFIKDRFYPAVIPNWDNSPRSGKRAVILTESTPELFEKHLEESKKFVLQNSDHHQIIMLKSWNEWAEGNYIEPDKKWGRAYLEKVKKVLT